MLTLQCTSDFCEQLILTLRCLIGSIGLAKEFSMKIVCLCKISNHNVGLLDASRGYGFFLFNCTFSIIKDFKNLYSTVCIKIV